MKTILDRMQYIRNFFSRPNGDIIHLPKLGWIGSSHRGVSERPVCPTNQVCGGGRAVHSPDAPLEHTLHDQVRNLRMELSDLKLQVSDLAATFGRA
jgi:hypothetical protein